MPLFFWFFYPTVQFLFPTKIHFQYGVKPFKHSFMKRNKSTKLQVSLSVFFKYIMSHYCLHCCHASFSQKMAGQLCFGFSIQQEITSSVLSIASVILHFLKDWSTISTCIFSHFWWSCSYVLFNLVLACGVLSSWCIWIVII